MNGMSYAEVMARKNEIMKKSLLLDYDRFEGKGLSFDYEGMMNQYGYSLDEIRRIQREVSVGDTWRSGQKGFPSKIFPVVFWLPVFLMTSEKAKKIILSISMSWL